MISCKEYTQLKKDELKKKIADQNLNIKLVIIQVGDDSASNSYIRGKRKDCDEVGIEMKLMKYTVLQDSSFMIILKPKISVWLL